MATTTSPISSSQRTPSRDPERNGSDNENAVAPLRANPRRSPNQKPHHTTGTNLYVGGLHDSVTDADLMKRFKLFGTIISTKVMLHIHTGQSRGIGFVKFENHESAAASIQALHRTMFNGQRIMVRYADARADFNPGDKTNKIFIRNLPFDMSAPQLRRYFAQFGTVTECTLHLDTAGFKQGGTGVRTRMAYVSFATVDQAQRAAEEVHGTKPFPTCQAAVMAKLAESEGKRTERRYRQRDHDAKCSPFATEASPRSSDEPSSGDTPHAARNESETPPSAYGPTSSGLPTSSSGSDKEKRDSSESDEVPTGDQRDHHRMRVSTKNHSPGTTRRASTPLEQQSPSEPEALAVTLPNLMAASAASQAAAPQQPQAQVAPTYNAAAMAAAMATPPFGLQMPMPAAAPLPDASVAPWAAYASSLGFSAAAVPPTAYSAPMASWPLPLTTGAPYLPGAPTVSGFFNPLMNAAVPTMPTGLPLMPPSAPLSFYSSVPAPMSAYPAASVPHMVNPYATALPPAVGYPPYTAATTAVPYAAPGYYTGPF